MSRNYRAGQGKLSNSWNWIVIGRLNTLPVAVVAVGGRCCTKQHLYSQQLTQYFFREKRLKFSAHNRAIYTRKNKTRLT